MFLLVTIAVCLLGATIREAEAASCHLREIDLCLATLLLGATDGIPGTDEEVDKICEPIHEGIECLGNYTESCFTPLMKEVYAMIMAEPKQLLQDLCTPGTEERAKYLKLAPCYQKTMAGDIVKPYVNDFMNAIETAAEAPFQKKVPAVCCGLHRLYTDMTQMVQRECGIDIVKEESEAYGVEIYLLPTNFCNGYETSSPKCNGVLPPSGTPSKGAESKLQLIQMLNTAMSNF